MGYRSEDIEKLNDNLKIEEVVGEFVELKKSGANYKGLCPFHPDTSPSFMISPSKNICKCFVCGEGGSPIKFYAQYKNIGFNEAVKELSEKYKI
ncbi:MAG: CHC2 zinc finger domain-containing protein, partial [Fusobacteriaceae bacterium]